MKSRKPILLLLLTSLLTPMTLQAQETTSLTDSLTRYGLESGKSYPAEVVAQLLDAAIAEGKLAVINAYNQGYKAGVMDYGPDSAKWESLASAWSKEAKAESKGPTWGTVFAGAGAGFLVGVTVGIGLCYLAK